MLKLLMLVMFGLVLQKVSSDLQKRNLFQFAKMIKAVTNRGALYFNDYGCWCGIGGSGNPVDGLDRCCKNHDKCYNRISRIKRCYPKWVWYDYKIRNKRITCDHKRRDNKCEKGTCNCDRIAALCFARSKYNRKNKNINKRKRC